jgi:hypothetical protein
MFMNREMRGSVMLQKDICAYAKGPLESCKVIQVKTQELGMYAV